MPEASAVIPVMDSARLNGSQQLPFSGPSPLSFSITSIAGRESADHPWIGARSAPRPWQTLNLVMPKELKMPDFLVPSCLWRCRQRGSGMASKGWEKRHVSSDAMAQPLEFCKPPFSLRRRGSVCAVRKYIANSMGGMLGETQNSPCSSCASTSVSNKGPPCGGVEFGVTNGLESAMPGGSCRNLHVRLGDAEGGRGLVPRWCWGCSLFQVSTNNPHQPPKRPTSKLRWHPTRPQLEV